MTNPIRWLLSLVFIIQMYLAMAVIAVVFTIPALLSRTWTYRGAHFFCAWVRVSLRLLCGLRTEIRGTVPDYESLIAGKHQSFLDIILIASAIPRPKFIMKRELIWAPFLGLYALRMGCIPVNRGKRGSAIVKMKADVRAGKSLPGQLVIYPQGTRVPPGEKRPYKVGAGLLYQELGQPCVPVGTNVGLFWPKHGILRKPGLAVVEFLDPIQPGLPIQEYMQRIEAVIEESSNRLMAEAGA